jgi:hypothetical protein
METGHMYRIRSASGTEASYSSLEEFTAAVRRGEVAPEDEIFHSRANRWLDVKSHPHYRGAMNWSGPLSADVIFSSAPPPPPAPAPVKPAAQSAAAGSHNGAPMRLQVAEIPTVAKPAANTLYRPQLAAEAQAKSASPAPAPAAKPAAPVPPPQPRPAAKAKELTFLELNEPHPAPAAPIGRHNATIIEARKPPVPPPSPAKPPTKAPEFLVMDTGLERPARGSNGQRAITGDADMLFDTPVAETLPPSQAAVSVPPTSVAPAVAAPTAAAAPMPAAPTPTPKPLAQPESRAPRKAEMTKVAAIADNLDIPGPPLLESPTVAVSPAQEPRPTPVSRGSLGLVIGSGAVVILAAGALIFWRPWAGKAQGADSDTTAHSAAGAEVQGLPAFAGAPETTTAAGAIVKPIPVASLSGGSADSVHASDSEQVIAPRPRLESEVPAPATDLDLGTDLAPPPTSNRAVAPSDLARHLETAEKQAQQELAARLGGFKGVLGAARLSSSPGAAQAQSAWNTGADAIRQYRAKIARLEQAYEDSALASQRAERWTGDAMRGWATRQSLAEPGETSQLVDLMLSQVSEGLGLLAGLDGQYDLRDGKIRFKSPASASRYVSIRSWVEQRTESWSSTPEGARPHTVSLILRALGDGFPPME